jgi:hypothetical protein
MRANLDCEIGARARAQEPPRLVAHAEIGTERFEDEVGLAGTVVVERGQ